MITSIPLSAQKLGLSFQDYEDLTKNLGRMLLISPINRQKIIERANTELPDRIKPTVEKLILELENESKKVYQTAGLDYELGADKPQNIFTEAVLDYLLRNPDKIKV